MLTELENALRSGPAAELESPAPFTAGETRALRLILRDMAGRAEDKPSPSPLREQAAPGASDALLSGMGHELRGFLNSINGMVQLLDQEGMPEEQRECVEVIKSSSQGLISLVDDILCLSRIVSGRLRPARSTFTLSTIIHEIVTAHTSLIRTKGIGIGIDIASDVPDRLTGDQKCLRRILTILLSISVAATSRGAVRISVAVDERRDGQAWIRIGVQASGIAIPPEMREQIFQPFARGIPSSLHRGSGSCLGLPIGARLAEMMGGKLELHSGTGDDSGFSLRIPLAMDEGTPKQRQPERQTRGNATWDGPELRILLVDDYELNLAAATRLLQRSGHSVVQARDGAEALRQWEEGEFDAILMDIQMPVMDGVEATRTIRRREQETGRHTPVIALTGRALQEEQDEITAGLFDGHISKPISMSLLFQEIARCLSEKGQPGDHPPPLPTPEQPETTIDRQRLTALMGEMEVLLNEHNMAVTDRVSDLLQAVPQSDAAEALRLHVRDFNFEGALDCLREIYREFDITR